MKIYDETGKEVTSPDLTAGYLTDEQRQIGETAEIPEASEDAEYLDHPGMHYKKITQPYVAPEPIYETVQIYHPNAQVDTAPTLEQRVSANEDAIATLMEVSNA